LGDLKWYYIVGTPLIALIIGLISYFFTDALWSSKIKDKSGMIAVVLGLLFFVSLFFHLWVYTNGTFGMKM
jgi:hypothetical protein